MTRFRSSGGSGRVSPTVPVDLLAVAALVALTAAVYVTGFAYELPLRPVLGFALVLFAPGYAFVAAVFPEGKESGSDGAVSAAAFTSGGATGAQGVVDGLMDRGIDGVERVVLSVGLSIAIVPFVALLLNGTVWGIRPVPVVLAVSAFTLVGLLVGAARRWRLPPEERFRVPYRQWFPEGPVLRSRDRVDTVLNVMLAGAVLLLVVSTAYVVGTPQSGDTEFYLLTGNDSRAVADDYPTELAVDRSQPVTIGITNAEHRTVEYTVVIELQRVRETDGSTVVTSVSELGRLSPRVGHNQSWTTTYDVNPSLTGERLRLAFMLYRDDPPGTTTIQNAYREVHLMVNVSSSARQPTRRPPLDSRPVVPDRVPGRTPPSGRSGGPTYDGQSET
ncbi:MAG: DUF1616 domain-containing protein [Haloarculaceae archaeon]